MATIDGTNGNDTLNGTSEADTINGLGGSDTINGQRGSDTINAGTGDDTVVVGSLAPVPLPERAIYDGGDGSDILDLNSVSQNLSVFLESLVSISPGTNSNISLSGQNFETLIFGSGIDDIRANGRGGPLSVRDVFLGAGNDTYDGGGGSMVSFAVALNVYGGSGNDRLAGGGQLYGDAGNDLIGPSSGSFSDLFTYGVAIAAADKLQASEATGSTGPFTDGLSVYDGGAGIDTFISSGTVIDLSAETVTAADGRILAHVVSMEKVVSYLSETVRGNATDNVLLNGSTNTNGADIKFYGGAGNDTLDSGVSGGLLDGGDGNDILYATRPSGSHFQTVVGGAGTDTVNFAFAFADATTVSNATGLELTYYPNASTIDVYQMQGVEKFVFTDRTIDIDANPLVDDFYYLARNRDVAASRLDADAHYEQVGWKEGRDPNADFSTVGYLAANADVNRSATNPLDHYDQFGWKEGRDPSATFDTTLYLLQNADVRASGLDPLKHYLQYGQAEGRQASAAIGTHLYADGFDPEYYLLSNADVAAGARSASNPYDFAFQHYENFGFKEGRDPNAWFDAKGYLAAYADVAAANANPLDHYATYGWQEGRDPSAAFDTSTYLDQNSDVAASGLNPLVHYLQYGAYESRSPGGDGLFDV